eukprot:NODE_497_length_2149_cov_43.115232_g460_i0.p1 GENE.NODE_497_length_2149_cov_43.115232_g460_i0~~NODE_497_length_2149_cov_43.115232_g460_i0.p1  ORF type:complete len:631 (+),score=180.51 NODE_497_length_2149_cov_43.115232_g460_i0:44-1894(+)
MPPVLNLDCAPATTHFPDPEELLEVEDNSPPLKGGQTLEQLESELAAEQHRFEQKCYRIACAKAKLMNESDETRSQIQSEVELVMAKGLAGVEQVTELPPNPSPCSDCAHASLDDLPDQWSDFREVLRSYSDVYPESSVTATAGAVLDNLSFKQAEERLAEEFAEAKATACSLLPVNGAPDEFACKHAAFLMLESTLTKANDLDVSLRDSLMGTLAGFRLSHAQCVSNLTALEAREQEYVGIRLQTDQLFGQETTEGLRALPDSKRAVLALRDQVEEAKEIWLGLNRQLTAASVDYLGKKTRLLGNAQAAERVKQRLSELLQETRERMRYTEATRSILELSQDLCESQTEAVLVENQHLKGETTAAIQEYLVGVYSAFQQFVKDEMKVKSELHRKKVKCTRLLRTKQEALHQKHELLQVLGIDPESPLLSGLQQEIETATAEIEGVQQVLDNYDAQMRARDVQILQLNTQYETELNWPKLIDTYGCSVMDNPLAEYFRFQQGVEGHALHIPVQHSLKALQGAWEDMCEYMATDEAVAAFLLEVERAKTKVQAICGDAVKNTHFRAHHTSRRLVAAVQTLQTDITTQGTSVPGCLRSTKTRWSLLWRACLRCCKAGC